MTIGVTEKEEKSNQTQVHRDFCTKLLNYYQGKFVKKSGLLTENDRLSTLRNKGR